MTLERFRFQRSELGFDESRHSRTPERFCAHFAKTGQRFRQLQDSSFAKSRTAWRCRFSVA